jgi:hypothetical protein
MRVTSALLLVIAGCSIEAPSPTAIPTPTPTFRPGLEPPAQTWIGVWARAGTVPPQEMSLEVDGQAWSFFVVTEGDGGGGGVTSFTLSDTSSVRLVAVADCHVFASFEANPGRMYGIRFEEDGSVSVQELDGIEAGPSLGEREGGPTDCD